MLETLLTQDREAFASASTKPIKGSRMGDWVDHFEESRKRQRNSLAGGRDRVTVRRRSYAPH